MSIVLAIESAIRGGSLCVHDGDRVIAELYGTGGVSRAEELLSSIDGVLRTAGVKPRDVETVAVSTGPGSFTGIRIGIATALGLRTATGAACVGVSLFEALCSVRQEQQNTVAMIAVRENQIGWQGCTLADSGRLTPATAQQGGTIAEFLEFARQADYQFVTDCESMKLLSDFDPLTAKTMVVHGSFAELIAECVLNGIGGEPQPVYLQTSAAGRF